jgi:hypothetical protein
MEANYRTKLRCPVGQYVIDLVVEGEGKRVAVQCDGDRKLAAEFLPEALERQLTLERLGWQFIRLRASEYYRDPEAGMKKLFKRLKDLGIDALGPAQENERAETDKAEALKKKVIERAEMIRSRWKEAPAPPPELMQGADSEGDEEGDEETADDTGQALEAA